MKEQFTIDIDPAVITDLQQRLSNTRWPEQIKGTTWEYGTDREYLKSLCNYWQKNFNWPKQQEALNKLSHFTTTIDDISIHFIFEKGKGNRSFPLLLTHGFPDSFTRFMKLLPLLNEPNDEGFSFDVIIPSIPGYGFSGIPGTPGMNPGRIATLFFKLVTEELGYEKFFAHGGDWGSSITEKLALQHGKHLLGIHLTDIPFMHLFSVPQAELSEPEKKYLQAGQEWQKKFGGYAMIQSTTPQTAAYGLNDSPAGLAAWIVEKFKLWSDNKGDIENCFSKDELLTNITIYWATQTINSAMRIYYETLHTPPGEMKKVETPTAGAIFPKDLVPAPKEYAARFFNITHWTDMPYGGHFAAMEQPQLLAADIRKFCKETILNSGKG